MSVVGDFELLRAEEIEELKTLARIYRHSKTGAEVLSLSNDDENKVFGITFRTPAPDSTGVAHILEHSVLCGSRKYPVKEPFVELLKGSLQTFLNAFTYPDKTSYPVASQNVKDFYNLIDVYLDAVFYPRLSPHTLKQEGWHYELEEGPDREMIYKGVVFNEMKGAYSSPDALLSQYSLQSLFPNTAYGFDSGGHPKEIPNLSYEQFLAFHRDYYHPSNARIFFYGDDDPEERLRILNGYLKDFGPKELDSRIALQPPFEKPFRVLRRYMVGEDNPDPKGMLTLNWVLTETTDAETNFGLRLLEHILLGMPASPLRKALIDSRLGEDLAGEGLGAELRQITFSAGLKGIDIRTADQVEALILHTLQGLAERRIDPNAVEAAFNTIEFALRENNTGRFPRGLGIMLRALTTWLYDGDPLALLRFEKPLEALKAKAGPGADYFERAIDRFFIRNTHRTTVLLEPDLGLRQKEEEEERERLCRARQALGTSGERAVIDETRELRQIQERPDPPEALATIPLLRIRDLDKENKKIPIEQAKIRGSRVLFHDLSTHGITYIEVGFDLRVLPEAHLPYLPLFSRALLEMGTETEDFVSLLQRIARKTGGIRPVTFTSCARPPQGSAVHLFLRGKAMHAQVHELTTILKDVLLTAKLDNRERFAQMVLQEKARCEQGIVSAGHQAVLDRIKAHFGEAHWAAEKMGGVDYLVFVRDLAAALGRNWDATLEILQAIRARLIERGNIILNVTAEAAFRDRLEAEIEGLLCDLPQDPLSLRSPETWKTETPPAHEAMSVPSQVNFVGKGANLYATGYTYHGSALAITRYLRNAWLWDRIRVQGGAYGAFCGFDRLSGVLTFVSYRDPNLLKTLDVFDRAGAFLSEDSLSREELDKSIIGAIGDLDGHMLPDAKGYTSLLRHLTGQTDEDRQQMREELLSATPDHFRAFGAALQGFVRNGIVKVIGSQSAIEAAARERPGLMTVTKLL
jgi:hypothetical protein